MVFIIVSITPVGRVLSAIYGGGDATSAQPESTRVKTFHSSADWQLHFKELKDSHHLVVIDFSATWCGPCRFIEPLIHAMADEFTDVEFIKIDVDELSDVAKEFNVEAMPTFVFLKKGKEIDKVVGSKADELKNKVKEHRA
ncbi:thioredoxin h2 [Trifolium medium]|uniref:Thioredoxin h2 n=1 Tax=Trifolium medium TaxID=97028 RepID=A0A392M1S1_9FABA|nr:thioredoxin h2 [Trifolium medium]